MAQAVLALLALLFSSVSQAATMPAYTQSSQQISCIIGQNEKGDYILSNGTANVVGKDEIITAEHVIRGAIACKFNGHSVTETLYENSDEDVVKLKVDTGDLPPMKIDCRGFKAGETYLAVGFPGVKGYIIKPPQITMEGTFPNSTFRLTIPIEEKQMMVSSMLVATDTFYDYIGDAEDSFQKSHHLRVLNGISLPGMSGGAVMDAKWRIRGMVTATDGRNSMHRDLSETGLCRK